MNFIGVKGDGGGDDNWRYNTCKASIKSSPSTNQHQDFTGWMSFLSPNQQCESTEGKASVILNMSTLRQHNTWLAVARRWLAVSVSVSKSYNRDDVSDTVTRVNDCPSQGTF